MCSACESNWQSFGHGTTLNRPSHTGQGPWVLFSHERPIKSPLQVRSGLQRLLILEEKPIFTEATRPSLPDPTSAISPHSYHPPSQAPSCLRPFARATVSQMSARLPPRVLQVSASASPDWRVFSDNTKRDPPPAVPCTPSPPFLHLSPSDTPHMSLRCLPLVSSTRMTGERDP